MRPFALLPALALAALLLVPGCASTETLPPTVAGTWRAAGSTGAFFRTTDQGDLGDRTEMGAEIGLGRFVTPRVLLEVGADASRFKQDVEGGVDDELSEVLAFGGFRYYFEEGARSRPYVGLGAGISTMEVKNADLDDSDTSLALIGRAGYETFLSPHVALDFGLRLVFVFDRELGGIEEDTTQLGFLVGFSAWF